MIVRLRACGVGIAQRMFARRYRGVMGEDLEERRGAIDLARERPFRLGAVEVRPSTREVVGPGGREVLEPRVMQVLVALARAGGEVVTRDDLSASCWDGRIVGEDAINRVLSRVRRISEGLAHGSWSLETITKVGYRLTAADQPASEAPAFSRALPRAEPDHVATPRRRVLLAGGLAAAAAAGVVGYGVWRLRSADQKPPADVAPLLAQAEVAIRQATATDDATAIGLLRQVTQRHPDYAGGWGILAADYAHAAHYAPEAVAQNMAARAKETADRALALDPGESNALLSRALLLPRMGAWQAVETSCRDVLARHPENYLALIALGLTLGLVGRCHERAKVLDKEALIGAPTPALLYTHVVALWAAGRLEDADRAMQRAMDIAPRHFAVWFTRLYLLLYTGRPKQALGMIDDEDNRPAGTAPNEIDHVRTVVVAIISQEPKAVAAATQLCLDQARTGAGHAENSMQFACAMGQLDAAFAVAEAYFFSRGFVVPDTRFAAEQSRYTRKNDRLTAVLFLPSTAPMRADPRFKALTEETGLERYWRASHSIPDYRT